MSQDLRDLFERERKREFRMPEGHESRFEQRLDAAFPQRRRRTYTLWAVAASVTLLLGFGLWLYRPSAELPATEEQQLVGRDTVQTAPSLSLGDLSPDLKKVEQYYTANINLELSRLDISGENKAVADGYLARLRELDAEYQDLVRELNEIGPNEETISAMIRNFQIRLELLQKLKSKLNELKQSRNETVNSSSV